MSSARYDGAWTDSGEKTKHARLKSTRLWTGSQCNWRDVVPLSSSSEKPSSGILDRLDFPDVAMRHAVKQ